MPTSSGMLSSETTQHKILIPVLICLCLAILTVTTFWSLKDCGFINLDDDIYVYKNAYVQSSLNWNSIKQAFFSSELLTKSGQWLPVIWLSLMLDYSIFGLNPLGYHLTNLLFHVINTLLLFLVLRRMTKALWPSALVAALFAIHPLHVESVAWITERKDVLSTFFWMLTLGAYSYYVEHPGFRRYCLVFLFFALGVMAKPMLATLPFVLLLLDYWPLNRFQEIKPDQKIQPEMLKLGAYNNQNKKSKKINNAVTESLEVKKPADPKYKWSLIYPLLWGKVPLFVLGILLSIVTYVATRIGGAVSVQAIPLSVRIGNAFVSYVAYIGKMILPINLAVLYPHTGVIVPWQVLGSIFLLIAITLVVIWRAKKFPYLATGWLWYLGTLAPVIGIVQAGPQAMADRFTYVPLIGLFMIVAWSVADLSRKWNYRKEILLTASALSILCLSIITWTQVGYWQNSITLFDHTLMVTNDNWFTYHARANAYFDLGNYKQAIEDYGRTIKIKPRYAMAYINRSAAYNNLGDYKEAITDLNRAIAINPDYAEAYINRGVASEHLGNYKQAIEDYGKVIEINSGFAMAYINRSAAYNKLGDYKEAITDLNRAIEINPGFAVAYINRGNSYNGLGNYKQAIEDLNRAIAINPDYAEAYINRGVAFEHLGNYMQAIEDFSRAIEINPGFAQAYFNRGLVYLTHSDNISGCRDAQKACELGSCKLLEIAKVKGICR